MYIFAENVSKRMNFLSSHCLAELVSFLANHWWLVYPKIKEIRELWECTKFDVCITRAIDFGFAGAGVQLRAEGFRIPFKESAQIMFDEYNKSMPTTSRINKCEQGDTHIWKWSSAIECNISSSILTPSSGDKRKLRKINRWCWDYSG